MYDKRHFNKNSVNRKTIMKNFGRIFLLLFTLGCFGGAFADVPANYYSKCENKSGAELLKALCSTVGPHTVVSYDGLWTVYRTSDIRSNGKVWDMYSTKEWVVGEQHCGNYKNVGDCINREHSMPKSWFNDASPMYSDAYHLYPTDGKVNGQRSNYPYGECAKGTTLASNGNVKALGKLGASTFSGYSGTVFEPDDEYKGDFARSYFYMAAAYNDRISGWSSEMLNKTTYPAFSTWALNLLLKWHRQDPVSQKELDRNEAVYAYQKNRNPFIDHPELAEYIWGDKKTEKWSSTVASQPTLVLPVNNSTIDLGTAGVGVARSFDIVIKGSQLTSTLYASLSGSGAFTLSPTSFTAASVNSANGTSVKITFKTTSAGTYSTTLRLYMTNGAIDTKVKLNIKAMNGLPATEATDITDESFMAHWTYIGGDDSNKCYTLYVLDEDGNDVDTYPRSVPALDEQYLVNELQPSTDYVFYIKNNDLESNRMKVRTSDPIPNVQILYDGDLYLTSEPGIPSEAAELFLDIDNIYDNIVFTVSEPFQLSSDKGNWSTTLTVDPMEDRIYIRIYGEEEGNYTSSINVAAGQYYNDDAEVQGNIVSTASFIEDFENEDKQTGSYTVESYTGNACKWKLSNAGVYKVSKEANSGEYYLRFGNASNSSAEMAEDKEGGVGTVKLQAAGWSKSDGSSKFKLQYSNDGGSTWTDAGPEVEIATPESSVIDYKQYQFVVNKPGKVRLRIQQTYGKRMCFDDIEASNYTAGVDDVYFGDERGTGWDAYSCGGQLVVELAQAAEVAVHGVDGVTYLRTVMVEGTNHVTLNPGLYIVVVGNSTRRVLVK